jgi:subtilisin family serine protease
VPPITDSPKLDPRFRAIDAIPDSVHGEALSGGPEYTRRKNIYRAIVLLVPGARRLGRGGPNAVDLLDDTFIAEGELADLQSLALQADVVYVEAPRPAVFELYDSVKATKADVNSSAPTNLTGKNVLVGIVDDGIDFRLDDFKDLNGNTRILYLWDQDLTAQGNEIAPKSYSGGVEYTQHDIDADLLSGSGAVRHWGREHGTHVAGIAVGNGQTGAPPVTHKGVAYEADIIFVALAPASKDERVTSSDWIVEAIKYIFDKAEKDVRKPAAVVNLSVGWNGGRHDGESVVERTIDRLLEQEGRALVKSAGNEPDWETHASGKVRRNEPYLLTWVFGNPDNTPNTMEIWYSSRDRFQVEVGDPNGVWSDPVDPSENITTAKLADTVHIESERFHVLNGQARILVRVGDPNDPNKTLTAGPWQVKLTGLEVVEGGFDAWIELDTRDVGNNYADQSRFDKADADSERTITPPGTIRRGIAVGNYDHRDTPLPSLAKSSGRGPTGDGRPKPEIAAPGTKIESSNAHHSGGATRIAKTGTSMSAPHVTGVVAQLLQQKKSLTAAQIRALLITSARRPGSQGPEAFDPEWGYGAVNAEEGLRLIR